MITGFSNERSSEYTILNDLYRKYEKHFSYFYPFHFHKNRDDTALSRSDNTQNLHLICLFSRRPKTNSIGSQQVYINFRSNTFFQSEFLYKYGISTISASPIASEIGELGFGATCQWFGSFSDIELNDGEKCNTFEKEITHTGDFILKTIDDEKLLKILESTKVFTWKEVLKIIKEWYHEYLDYAGRNMFNTYSGQKPVFIVYKFKND